MSEYTAYFQSVIGQITLVAREETLVSCLFSEDHVQTNAQNHPLLNRCLIQLHEYFRGDRRTFSLDLQPRGTLFQQRVWQQLLRIPFANTVSYREIATAIGRPQAAQAIGQANRHNPIAIMIPCHRVINSQGKIGGYAAGVWRKAWLLEHEKRLIQKTL